LRPSAAATRFKSSCSARLCARALLRFLRDLPSFRRVRREGLVHADLPPLPGGAVRREDVRIQAKADELFRWGLLRSATAPHFGRHLGEDLRERLRRPHLSAVHSGFSSSGTPYGWVPFIAHA
jgi:hypothetical protein